MKDIFIVIPTLNPSVSLLRPFIDDLLKKFNNVLLFNDGSRKEYDDFFQEMKDKGVLVLNHYINLGKGRALKDAFNYILCNYPNIKGIVCADSDGQHSVNDIYKCAKLVLKYPDDLILGCRDFNNKNVPLRNKTGNKLTILSFRLFVGIKISDTQTGLRGLGRNVMRQFLNTKGERFDYENLQLIETKEKNINIREFSINTIYNDETNKESHFSPFKDSVAIYKTFLTYIISSVLSFVTDITIFSILNKSIEVILYCTIIARVISSLVNYFLNARLVFKNCNKYSIIKYYILVIINMFLSGFLTTYIVNYWGNVLLTKVIVDITIFIMNYYIQNKFIFIKK